MYSGTYCLAGVPIHICSLYDEVQLMLADYVTPLSPQFEVVTTEEDLETERVMSDKQMEADGEPPVDFPLPYLETLSVYRKIAAALLPLDVLLMHGSVIAVDGEAYMFTAVSGTGKSTHTRLWRQLFGTRAVMVNDDKPLIRIHGDNGRPIVYGTPWDGKHHLSHNIAVPLKAIVILQRGEQNEIHPVSIQEAFPTLLQQSFRTAQLQDTVRAMQLLSDLAQNVALYTLHCNMNPEAAVVAYNGMQNN